MDDYINKLENNDPTLVELNLFSNTSDLWRNINDKKRFVNSLKNNTHLKYLKIYCDNFIDEIVEILKHNINLQGLRIYGIFNTNGNDINKIINALKINTTLQILDISIGHINDNNAIEITNMLRVNTTLQKLNISHNHFSKAGLIEIVNALRINTSLKVLDVSWNEFKYDDVRNEIIDILQYNHTLEKLEGVYLGDFLSPENKSIRKRFLTT